MEHDATDLECSFCTNPASHVSMHYLVCQLCLNDAIEDAYSTHDIIAALEEKIDNATRK